MDIVEAVKLNGNLKRRKEKEERGNMTLRQELDAMSALPGNETTRSEKTFISPVTGYGLNEEDYNSLFKPTLKDSGARREFDTGAVRDIADGKGRCDLLPLDIVGDLLDNPILKNIERFKETKDPEFLIGAMRMFSVDVPTTILEVSKHYEDGAKKYSENNWKKGIPLHCYIDSGVRHYLKWLRSDNDEPHDRAFVWNMLCALWTLNHKPEMDDIDADI